MRKKMVRIILVLGLVSGMSVGHGMVAPANACNGDVCDWVCAFQDSHPKPLGPCRIG